MQDLASPAPAKPVRKFLFVSDEALIGDTATRIATARASDEGREGIRSFLEKRRPAWLPEALAAPKAKKSKKKS